jgi:hypothetical protein
MLGLSATTDSPASSAMRSRFFSRNACAKLAQHQFCVTESASRVSSSLRRRSPRPASTSERNASLSLASAARSSSPRSCSSPVSPASLRFALGDSVKDESA